MPSVTLHFPVLVKNIEVDEKMQYYLRPLLFQGPMASHRRFERAVALFKREVKSALRSIEFNRENMDRLLWFRFNPQVEYKALKMEFVAAKQFVKGKFGVGYFILQDKCFVCLPAFDSFMFIGEKDEKGKYHIPQQAEETVRNLIRSYKKETKDDIDVQSYVATRHEFVTTLKFTVNVDFSEFQFEQNPMSWFFSMIGANHEFKGHVEILKVGFNLNDKYPGELKRAYYREDLVKRVSEILYQFENTPVVILGREGAGKRSIIHEVVYRYMDARKKVKENKKEIVWRIDPTRVIAGMSVVGMWQKRLESIFKFVIERGRKYKRHSDKILIDNVVALLRIGKSGQNDMTMSDVIKPYLEKRLLQFVLVATPEEWKIIQEKDRRFADLFQIIRVPEPDLKTAIGMVTRQRRNLELEYDCSIGTMAIAQLFNIQRNYLRRKAMPGSVMKLLNQLATKYKFREIDAGEVREEFEMFSGLHQDIFDAAHTYEKDEIRKAISAKLVGQQDAVDALADIIHTIKAKLTNPDKPYGSFLFIGPTGVGKTQAAKVLASYLMGSEDTLMRFDMNEYIGPDAVSRLIGDYYNPEGQLTGKVRYRPFGVLLFDEIEKAHPKVLDLLLQVLDDGRLTDSLGRTVDFTNTIIIMTSNVGAREASSILGFKTNASEETAVYRKAMQNKFRPEFINRIGKIVIFNPLALDHIMNIARLQINELLRRDGFVRRTTILNISEKALNWVAERGFDAKMGGRALKRQIERDLTTLSAEQLISTYSSQPIIFDILFKNKQLVPDVQVLRFAEPGTMNWFPKLPEGKNGRKFYGRLLREVEGMIREINDFEEEEGNGSGYVSESEWQRYHFKNKLQEVQERAKRMVLATDEITVDRQIQAIRLKRVGGSILGERKDRIREMYFQKETMEELSNQYTYADSYLDVRGSRYLDLLIELDFLKIYKEGYYKDDFQKIEMSFKSLITKLGKEEIEYLIETYSSLLQCLDVKFKTNKKKQTIEIEGLAIQHLMNKEAGVHLFYREHSTPIPVLVSMRLDKEEPNRNLEVIRLYHSNKTLTDLRTGFVNAKNIRPEELKLLIFGGIRHKGKSKSR